MPPGRKKADTATNKSNTGATLGFEAQMFLAADKLRIVQDVAGAVTGVKDVHYEPGYRTALP